MAEIVLKELSYAIVGAAMEVHRILGPGFLEAVYHEALAIEMTSRDIPFTHEVVLPIYYKGQQLATTYRADFLCFDRVIVELKALTKLSSLDEAQILNYLKAKHQTLPANVANYFVFAFKFI